ncbi:MAG: acyltransferase family protein [Thermoanaerobaculia bacterium]
MSAKIGAWFPGLNGLRFFAAMAVAFSHVELLKQYHGLPNVYDKPAVYELGRLSVTLFFVLSGYLITYLLLVEKEGTGSIAIGRFYVRRILRIWPLYYLVVLASFLVLPRIDTFHVPRLTEAMGAHFGVTFTLFILFLPQLALSIRDPVPFAEPAWSIGVEEQFYLLWPLLLRRTKNFVALAAIVIVAVIGARYGALWMAKANRADGAALALWNQTISYLYFTRIECMAIGGLFAWIVFAKKRAVLNFLYSRLVQAIVYALTAWLLVTDSFKPIFNYGWSSVCFGVLILNVSTNPRSLIRMPGRAFEFLGNISFSIYMLHEIAIQVILSAGWTSNAALYGASMLLTVAAASACYLWFERPFLRLKARFAVAPRRAESSAIGRPSRRSSAKRAASNLPPRS